MGTTIGLSDITIIFFIFLAILWIILPFAVFGVKKRLEELIDLQKDMLAAIAELRFIARALSRGPLAKQIDKEDPGSPRGEENVDDVLLPYMVESIKKEIMKEVNQGALFIKSRIARKFNISSQQFDEICDTLCQEKKIQASQREQLQGKSNLINGLKDIGRELFGKKPADGDKE